MGHETLKRIILEKYEFDTYLVCGNKNTKDCLGVNLDEALENIREQMEEITIKPKTRSKTKRYSLNYEKIYNANKKTIHNKATN